MDIFYCLTVNIQCQFLQSFAVAYSCFLLSAAFFFEKKNEKTTNFFAEQLISASAL